VRYAIGRNQNQRVSQGRPFDRNSRCSKSVANRHCLKLQSNWRISKREHKSFEQPKIFTKKL